MMVSSCLQMSECSKTNVVCFMHNTLTPKVDWTMSCPLYPPLVNNDGELSGRQRFAAEDSPLLLQVHDDFASMIVRRTQAWSVYGEDSQRNFIVL